MHHHTKHQPRRAFTLTEIVVAIAAVLIITAAVGQVFSSVSSLVGTGAAISETDQTARVITAQITDDAEAFARAQPDETFLAIRSNRLGDRNNNGALDAGERAVYLSQEDKDFDEANNITPYSDGSRAVTLRLDQLMLLGESPDFFTRQQASLEENTPAAPFAIIHWGHALRPAIDRTTIPTDADGAPEDLDITDENTFPTQRFYPDGTNPSANDGSQAWFNAFGAPFSANEFAATFPLARHELLLAGPTAFAFNDPNQESSVGARREVALLPRDNENYVALGLKSNRLNFPNLSSEDEDDLFTRDLAVEGDDWNGVNNNFPMARATTIAAGRADILAMTRSGLQRYLEGQSGSTEANDDQVPPNATPFEAGALDRTNVSVSLGPGPSGGSVISYSAEPSDLETAGAADAPLWIRTIAETPATSAARATSDNPEVIRNANNLGIRRAIAGMFARRLARTQPPLLDRRFTEDPDDGQPEDALMDTHAVIAAGCSNLEIAWSNGFRAPVPFSFIDFDDNGSGQPQFAQGAIVWFDAEHTLTEFLDEEITPESGTADDILDAFPFLPAPVETVPTGDDTNDLNDQSIFRDVTDTFTGSTSTFFADLPVYNDEVAELSGSDEPDNEYLAIWGFRLPNSTGGWGAPWQKPTHIRVRMTLHDEQNRLENGKQYEVILSLER